MAWSDIPTCKEAGVDVEYQMLRGIFMPPGVEQQQVEFYVDLLSAVVQTPDWKTFMEQGAFNQTVMTGDTFRSWLETTDKQHFELMKSAGFLAEAK
jgi:tripartite-type tricarboxylate transporter receptor subunit TctC